MRQHALHSSRAIYDSRRKMATPSVSGAWHLSPSYRYRFDESLARGIMALIHDSNRSATLLDMGAGKGHYVKFWKDHGIDVHGVEGADNIEAVRHIPLVMHADLSKPLSPCVPYDWVTCLEVGEHVPREFESTIFANINCSARQHAIVSWAVPGQLGNGHVNTRAKAYVDKQMGQLGFVYDRATSASLRRLSKYAWFRRNIVVFHRSHSPPLSAK